MMKFIDFQEKLERLTDSMVTGKRILTTVFLLLTSSFLFLVSCSSEQTNLKSLSPNETLIYLETNDLGIALEALTENKTFKESSVKENDLSSVKGVQLAIAITGFETSEKQVTDQNSILNFKPRLVAIADTHLWSWQTRAFAEEVLGNFINETYGGEINLEIEEKDGGTMYEWTALDQRKAYAFVKDSKIIFSNDQAAIEKCLSVQRGESESLLKNENLKKAYDSNAANKLAFGFVSTDGIAQIASLVGVSTAIEATEEDGGRSFIARVLPQILRNTTKEIVWTASKTEGGIEDKFSAEFDQKYSSVFKETFVPGGNSSAILTEFLPTDLSTVTRYSLKNPLIAWRSLLLVTKETTDAVSGSLLHQFSKGMLASYGVSDSELFLSSVESEVLTAQFSLAGDQGVTIATVKDKESLKKSLVEIIDISSPSESKGDAEIWKSKDKVLFAAFVGNILILGDSEIVLKSLEAKRTGQSVAKNPLYARLKESTSTAVTLGQSRDSVEKLVNVLGEFKEGSAAVNSVYLTQTEFTAKGVERTTVSDFGFIGTIIEQFDE